MDDNPVPNSNYALQLALQTMKERCVQLQKRVATLQDENLALKANAPRIHDSISSNSLDTKVSRLTEERNQLKNTITMVAAENKQLWSSLSRLAQENKSFAGSKHSNIDGSQHDEKTHMPLIRSRTFTQEAPHTKHLQKVLSESDKVSLELEDISLKQKEIREDINDSREDLDEVSGPDESLHSLGFNYLEDEEVDDSLSDCIEQHLLDLKNIKFLLVQHNEVLRLTVDSLKTHKVELEQSKKKAEDDRTDRCATKSIQVQIEDEEKVLEAQKVSEQQDWGTPDGSLKLDEDMDKICPMCNSKFYPDVEFDVFSRHVEEHFMDIDVLRL